MSIKVVTTVFVLFLKSTNAHNLMIAPNPHLRQTRTALIRLLNADRSGVRRAP